MKKKSDPFLERELQRYECPVASREFILDTLKEKGQPLTLAKLINLFALKDEAEKEGLRRRLRAMERDGQLTCNAKDEYCLPNRRGLIEGRVEAHRDGFGFLITDKPGEDIFLSPREMKGVFNNDRVLVRCTAGATRRRKEAAIVQVIERNTHQVAGRFITEDGVHWVVPDDKSITQDIIIAHELSGGATEGQFVVAEIMAQPTKHARPTGKVIQILGDMTTPGLEVALALRSHELPFEWPQTVLDEVIELPDEVLKSDRANRHDLRKLPFITIDGEDARDFDDAVFCKAVSTGWKLYVAIADVTAYVEIGTDLDLEAVKRGNSVYFPSAVIPMLPEKLSNELCSLKPHVDRLALVCEIDINKQGIQQSYQFYEAVIHSHERFTYNAVADIISNQIKNHPLFAQLNEFYQLYQKLLAARQKRGAIEFNSVETQVLFDAHGKIQKIIPRHRNEAHRMIEEAMLLANVSAADFLEQAAIHTLYRVHEAPDEIKLTALRDFLKPFHLTLSGGLEPRPLDFVTLLAQIERRTDAQLLQTVMLRSMQQAHYHPENRGHFGLAFERYTHFTSPIRRYPDVMVHRAIKHVLEGKKAASFIYDLEMMADIAEHCSFTERRADLATRDAMDWLKCEFMQAHLGEVFDGIIVDVTSFGIFVELREIYVQGLVHITQLPEDYYQHEPTHHLLRGKRTNKIYRLGDTVRVLVARVDMDKRQIDFSLASSD